VYWIVHDELHILNVAVHPEVRRCGIGKGLMKWLMLVCERERLQYVSLEVRAGNEAAIGLYEAFAFKRIGLRRRYYSDNGEDAVIMARVLEER
jgi:ribosomal-protein-alanine N-acetyltransferase